MILLVAMLGNFELVHYHHQHICAINTLCYFRRIYSALSRNLFFKTALQELT